MTDSPFFILACFKGAVHFFSLEISKGQFYKAEINFSVFVLIWPNFQLPDWLFWSVQSISPCSSIKVVWYLPIYIPLRCKCHTFFGSCCLICCFQFVYFLEGVDSHFCAQRDGVCSCQLMSFLTTEAVKYCLGICSLFSPFPGLDSWAEANRLMKGFSEHG